jgi:hypothetical protein
LQQVGIGGPALKYQSLNSLFELIVLTRWRKCNNQKEKMHQGRGYCYASALCSLHFGSMKKTLGACA